MAWWTRAGGEYCSDLGCTIWSVAAYTACPPAEEGMTRLPMTFHGARIPMVGRVGMRTCKRALAPNPGICTVRLAKPRGDRPPGEVARRP